MEEFYIIKHEQKFYLCSKDVLIDDVVFFKNLEEDNYKFGKIKQIYDNTLVSLLPIEFNDKLDNNAHLINDIKIENCFYPIIELFNNFEEDIKISKIKRKNITLKTICPKCKTNPRDNRLCSQDSLNCMKSEKKSYAYINSQN